MCWSENASIAMVGLGTVATVVTVRRGEPAAIPVTLAFFTAMEALQVSGYWVLDACETAANRNVTILSYLHIAFQPLFINAFAMATAPREISQTVRRRVLAVAALATILLLMRLIPFDQAIPCDPGSHLCGPAFCTVSGNWHIAWEMPLNDIWRSLGMPLSDLLPFPAYMLSAFVLPLFYGAWRFALFHATVGPVLASLLTTDPNEMPAIWCLFSIGIVLVSLSPAIRGRLLGSVRPGLA